MLMVSISVKLTLPKKQFKNIRVQQAITEAQRNKTRPELLDAFRGTVSGWKNPPSFIGEQVSNSRRISTTVRVRGTGNSAAYRHYNIVNFGAPAHKIMPRKKGFLRFQSGYLASTVPGQLFSRSSKRYGNWYTSFNGVLHPGIEPRRFDQLIAEKYKPVFMEDMQEAINKAAKEYG